MGTTDMAVGLLDGDLLDVRTERTVRDAVGVADATTSRGCLTANFANLGHVNQLHLLTILIGFTHKPVSTQSLSMLPQQLEAIQELFMDYSFTFRMPPCRRFYPCGILAR